MMSRGVHKPCRSMYSSDLREIIVKGFPALMVTLKACVGSCCMSIGPPHSHRNGGIGCSTSHFHAALFTL